MRFNGKILSFIFGLGMIVSLIITIVVLTVISMASRATAMAQTQATSQATSNESRQSDASAYVEALKPELKKTTLLVYVGHKTVKQYEIVASPHLGQTQYDAQLMLPTKHGMWFEQTNEKGYVFVPHGTEFVIEDF